MELLVVAVIEKWADSCASDGLWSVLENPYFFQRFWVDNLGITISGAGHKHCEIVRHKKLKNLLGVQIFLFDYVTLLVEDHYAAIIGRDVNRFVQRTPNCVGEYCVLLAFNDQCDLGWLVLFFTQHLIEVKNANCRSFLIIRKREHFTITKIQQNLLKLHRLPLSYVDLGNSLAISNIENY